MKKIITLTILGLLFFTLNPDKSSAAALTRYNPDAQNTAPKVVSVVADVWCPYNCSPESYNPGFMVEIMRESFQAKNIEIQYSNLPWERAVDEVRKGNHDAVIGATKGDAPDFIYPEKSQGISKNSFYVRAGESWKYKGVNSLKEKVVGVIEGYDYGGNFSDYIKENKNNNLRIQFVSGENALEMNITKLLNRRIDVIAEDQAVMSDKLSKLGYLDKITFVSDTDPVNVEEAFLYVAFSPKNEKSSEYAKILSEGTIELRKSGRLKEILDKYNIKDWQM